MSAYSAAVLAHPSLRAYYRHGEATGTTLVDSGPNGLNGTYAASGIAYGVAGLVLGDSNTAVTFDGTSDPATVPDNNALDLGDGPFSIEFLFKRSATQGVAQAIVGKGGNSYLVRFSGTNLLQLRKSDSATVAQTASAITDTGPHHAILTKILGGAGKIYLDGTDVTSGATTQTLVDTANILRIGHSGAGTQRFPGTLDELAIYGAELSPTEALAHAKLALWGSVSPPAAGIAVDAPDPGSKVSILIPSSGLGIDAPDPGLKPSAAAPAAGIAVDAADPGLSIKTTPPAGTVVIDAPDPMIQVSLGVPASNIEIDTFDPTYDVKVGPPTSGVQVQAHSPTAAGALQAVVGNTPNIQVSSLVPTIPLLQGSGPPDGGGFAVRPRRKLQTRSKPTQIEAPAASISVRSAPPIVRGFDELDDELLIMLINAS